MKVIQFQGDPKAYSPSAPQVRLPPITELDLTPSPDVPLAIMKRKLMSSNDITVAKRLLTEIDTHLKVSSSSLQSRCSAEGTWNVLIHHYHDLHLTFLFQPCVQVRTKMADTVRHVVEKVTGSQLKADEVLHERSELFQHGCYKAAVRHFKQSCFNWNNPEVRPYRSCWASSHRTTN